MSKMGLEHHYSGDKAWQDVAKLAMESWTGSATQGELLRLLNGDRDLAAVVYARMGDQSPKWITGKIPALGGKTPVACLTSPGLVRRLREVLMRMD